ncbi:MAG TPA: fibronectin type III domain-containing protein, partial [Clostridiaceae bacterium]|nr:fibronectin type III domain-containing protein [Clostridiaceae bacterium]
ENPGIYGPGIPNTYFEDNVDNLIQVGALNTDEGVRLVMYINGQKVFDCVDTQENRLTEPGYFGTYQQVRPMTISRTFITADRESAEEDTTAPTWPAGSKVEAIEVGQTDLTLIWTAAEDDTAVTGYNIYMGEELLDSVAADVYTYDVTGLTAGTEYTFTVQAVDAAGNESVDGPSVTVTTTAEETLIIQNPVFKDALGQELEHLIPSIDLRASVTIVNNGSKKANACFIIALYGPEKTFEKLAYIQGTIDAGETITLNGGFTLPDDVTGHFVKVFVWDSFEGMQPLSKAVIFE